MTCQLIVYVRNVLKSDVNRSKSYDRNSIYILKFDENRKIFFNKVEHLNSDPKISPGEFPKIDLGVDEEYYYVGNMWYASYKDGSGKATLAAVH